MSLSPLPHALDIFGTAEVTPPKGRAPPTALIGPFPGLTAGGLFAVVLALGVAVIGEEELAAAAALTSLRSQTHCESKPPRSRSELKPNSRMEEGPGGKKEEGIWREVPEENPGQEEGISNRRNYTISNPPLTLVTSR
jgi:hypothetical protein